MALQDTDRRLRRAAEIARENDAPENREELLWRAWELLQNLRPEEFPEELRPKFEYLRHELSLRKGQEMTAREVNFLLERIQEIGANGSEPSVADQKME